MQSREPEHKGGWSGTLGRHWTVVLIAIGNACLILPKLQIAACLHTTIFAEHSMICVVVT